MADPLQNHRAGDFDRRAELNRGSRVAYQAPLEDSSSKAEMNPDRQLPNPGSESPERQLEERRLVRVAGQIGGALGKTVSQARRVPASAKHGIYLVTDRAQEAASGVIEQLSTGASFLAGNAEQRAREMADAAQIRARGLCGLAEEQVSEWMDAAEIRGRELLDRADRIGRQLRETTGALRQHLDERTRELRASARLHAAATRIRAERAVRERPLHVLGALAAASFLLGVSLRIVRSRHARCQ